MGTTFNGQFVVMSKKGKRYSSTNLTNLPFNIKKRIEFPMQPYKQKTFFKYLREVSLLISMAFN